MLAHERGYASTAAYIAWLELTLARVEKQCRSFTATRSPCHGTQGCPMDADSDSPSATHAAGARRFRDRLALQRADWRTQGTDPDYRYSLANERTFLAWIRTALSLIAAAVAVVQLIPPFRLPGSRTFLGAVLATAGLACAAASYARWSANEQAMRHRRSLPMARGLIWLSGALVVVGVAVLLLVLFAPK